MSYSAQLQANFAGRLALPGQLRAPVPIIRRREKEIGAEIEAAAARNEGLCIYVMPILPTGAMDDVPVVFFERSDARIRLIEQPAKNAFGADCYQIAQDVALSLHWHMSPLLAHPLQLAPRVTEDVEDKKWRIVDLIFSATYQLPQRAVPVAELTIDGNDQSAELRAAVIAQLQAGLVNAGVPIAKKPDHDLGERIATSGDPISLRVSTPIPRRALQGADFVFFEGFEVKVTVIEYPALNDAGYDAYDLVEDVASALHWQPFEGLLAHPLQLARQPTRDSFDFDKSRREIDVIFNATFGFQPE